MIQFEPLFRQAHNKDFRGTLLALDPGETTGMSVFVASDESINLTLADQLETWPLSSAVKSISTAIILHRPKIVVLESYRVYGWKTEDHSFSDIPTLQIIGCIKTLLIQNNIPFFEQNAQSAKQFCTDDKLERWGFWQSGQKHARDSIRHAVYYLIFGAKKD